MRRWPPREDCRPEAFPGNHAARCPFQTSCASPIHPRGRVSRAGDERLALLQVGGARRGLCCAGDSSRQDSRTVPLPLRPGIPARSDRATPSGPSKFVRPRQFESVQLHVKPVCCPARTVGRHLPKDPMTTGAFDAPASSAESSTLRAKAASASNSKLAMRFSFNINWLSHEHTPSVRTKAW